jgi:prolipoprotein diacylglyceryltransferase
VLLSTALLIVMAIHFMNILSQGSAAWAGLIGAVLAVLVTCNVNSATHLLRESTAHATVDP